MTVLVTGGGGFLGRHIVAKLLARGERVRILGRSPQPDLAARGVEVIQGDMADPAVVHRAAEGVAAVFHVAALAGVWGPEATYRRINVEGTRNVLSACRAHGVPKLIYTSTPSVVYGNDPIKGGDESLPYPARYLTHYAATKAEAERMVLEADGAGIAETQAETKAEAGPAAGGKATLSTCSLRPHLIWGPGDNHLIPRILQRARAGRLRRVGDGSNRISVAYVENVADAHLAAWERLTPDSPVHGQAYFINEPEPVNAWDFINRILTTLGEKPLTRSVSRGMAYAMGAILEGAYTILGKRDEPPMTRFVALQLATSHWFKIDKARRDLGWTPTVSIDEGLNRLAADSQA